MSVKTIDTKIEKSCNTCGISKTLECYTNNKRYKDGKENRCKECVKEKNKKNKDKLAESQKKWRNKNPEYMKKYEKKTKRVEYMKKYYVKNSQAYKDRKRKDREKNPERESETRKKYNEKNKDKINQYHRIWKQKKRETDSTYKIKDNISRRIRYELNTLLKGGKSKKTIEYIGCTIEELKNHLEALFDDNMTWDNYGSYWHIDHIIPCAAWNLTQDEDNKYCWNFRNLQPLMSSMNQSKRDKYNLADKEKYLENMKKILI